MKHLAPLLTLLLAGCAVPTTGVTPLSDGLFKVVHSTNAGVFYNADQFKADAVKEASAYCEKDAKRFRLVDINQRPPRPLGGWPEAEVLFKCE